MATKSISKNTGNVRFFIDSVAAGVVRDVKGNVAIFVAHGSDFLDILTGEIHASGAPAATYLMDTYPAFAAFSLRQINGDSTAAIRVRESSGNTELDIGFSDGWLDETALLAHCGANDGWITKWYDQSGNARDAIQATEASQPRIVNAGVVDKINGKPGALSPDTATHLATATWSAINPPFTTFSVFTPQAVGNSTVCGGIDASNRLGWYFIDSAPDRIYTQNGSTAQADSPIGSQNVLTALWDQTNEIIRVDGSGLSVSGGQTDQPNIGLKLFSLYNNSLVGNGAVMQEFLFYNSDQSANFAGIETDMNTAFSVYA